MRSSPRSRPASSVSRSADAASLERLDLSGLIGLLATVVFVALVLFIATMWVRLIVDWVRALRPKWRPSGVLLVAVEMCFAVTDPSIRLVRRVVKPVRVGGGVLDFAWSIVLLLALVLLYVVAPLRG